MINMRNGNILLFLFFILSKCSGKGIGLNGKDAWAHSTEIVLHCFSADSFIELANGKRKLLSSLRSGDEILTIDQSNVVSTEMILMLDEDLEKEVLFYTFQSESGHQISLTEYHLIPIKSLEKDFHFIFAKEIEKGNLLYLFIDHQIKLSPVKNVKKEMKKGYLSPLTMKGTLLVNQILSSSFAHLNNHHSAQFAFLPLRFFYRLRKVFFKKDHFFDKNSSGIHWIVSIFFHLIVYLPGNIFFF